MLNSENRISFLSPAKVPWKEKEHSYSVQLLESYLMTPLSKKIVLQSENKEIVIMEPGNKA